MEISTIRVNASGEYDVIIGKNLISNTGALLSKVVKPCKVALITDDVVDALYANALTDSLNGEGFCVAKFVFQNGEQSKNITTYTKIINFLAENSFTRSDCVVALGGGVVGDMAGFCATTFLLGIKYVQIPTTLLSQIDSSVGGKTGVDLPSGKNLVGAYKQPSLVVCDVDTLKTLPKKVFIDGMGECAKYAFLDSKVNQLIENDYDIEQLVYLCIDYKRKIVENDEFESGPRKLLNLGHTPAHAIETLSEYKITHGKAVAMGLDIILQASHKHGYLSKEQYEKFKRQVQKCVGQNVCPYSIESICERALCDKKRKGNAITLIMVHGVGDCRLHEIDVDKLTEYLR